MPNHHKFLSEALGNKGVFSINGHMATVVKTDGHKFTMNLQGDVVQSLLTNGLEVPIDALPFLYMDIEPEPEPEKPVSKPKPKPKQKKTPAKRKTKKS